MTYEVKGSSIRSKLVFVCERFGQDCEEDLLEELGRDRLARVLDSSWYPYELYLDVLRSIVERCFGGDLSGLQEVGADSARRALETTYRAFRTGSYTEFLSRISRLHRALYSEGDSAVRVGEDERSCTIVLSAKPRLDEEDLHVALGFYLECGRLLACPAIRGSFEVTADEARFDLEWDERRSRTRLPSAERTRVPRILAGRRKRR